MFVVIWVVLVDYIEVAYSRIMFEMNNSKQNEDIELPMLGEGSGNVKRVED